MTLESKAPSFTPMAMNGGIITEVALHLVAMRRDGEGGWTYDPAGTAVVIAPHLAITAKHCVDDYWRKFQAAEEKDSLRGTFSLGAVQMLRNNRDAVVWGVSSIASSACTDIAFLDLTAAHVPPDFTEWTLPEINLFPPKVGSRIFGFGYHEGKASFDGKRHQLNRVYSTSVGEVLEVHEVRRDRSLVSFPCFRTNARFDHGMSGGPVFNSDGELCGLVLSEFSPDADAEQHDSYITTLWPMAATMIEFGRRHPPIWAHDLMRDGVIRCKGWDRIAVSVDDEGVVEVRALA